MIRESLISNGIGRSTDFHWRGNEITRIEGLSDAVFAFAVTLLVVSLEVPKTFTELAETMHGFGAFLISFVLIFAVWFNQYKFFSQVWLTRHDHGDVERGIAIPGSLLRLSTEVFVLVPDRQVHRRARRSATSKRKCRSHDREP
jgi:hypothetical protein